MSRPVHEKDPSSRFR